MPSTTYPLASLIPVLVYFVISLILVYLAFGFIKWLFWGIGKQIGKINKSLSGSLATKFVCLAVAGFFVPFAIPSFLQPLIRFVVTFLAEWSKNLIFGGNEVIRLCNRLGIDEFSECALTTLASPFLIITNSFNQAINSSGLTSLPIGNLMGFLAIWIILVELIHKIQIEPSASNDPKRENSNLLQKISSNPILSSNIAFFLLLIGGLYLSIASIAAIPNLQVSQVAPEEASVERLEQRLGDTANQFKRRFATEGDEFDEDLNPFVSVSLEENNPLNSIEEHLQSLNLEQDFATLYIQQGILSPLELPRDQYDNFNSKIKNLYSPAYNEGQLLFITAQSQRKYLIDQASLMLVELKKEIDEIMRAAITEYEFSNVDRIGSRETVDHFILITNWFDESVSLREARLDECMSAIKGLDLAYSDVAKTITDGLQIDEGDIRNVLLDANNSSVRIFPMGEEWYDDATERITTGERTAREACWLGSTNSQEIPKRPELGANFGPFKFVASWLLKTESLSLALITGLLGFGLLGSACSSFVRERIAPVNSGSVSPNTSETVPSAQPLVKDLAKVIIIGLSAAILAFLAVVGGLSLFSVNANEPNPYALLLACLVASVFGEDIWDWAREELRKRKGQEPDTGQPKNLPDNKQPDQDNVSEEK